MQPLLLCEAIQQGQAEKICVDFFVLFNSTHYFIMNIDVYQENIVGNIDKYARAANTPTTNKEFFNGIITEGVGNDPYVARKLF